MVQAPAITRRLRIAAENGATAHELKAMFGWRTLKEAERYTKPQTKSGWRARRCT
jgi:hypothetical protein